MNIDDFLSFEENNGLLEDNINGFYYWFFIRDKLYNKLSGLEPDVANFSENRKKIDKILHSNVMGLMQKKIKISDVFSVLKNLTISNPIFYRKRHEILIFPSPRRIFKEGKYYAMWTDGLADYYGKRCICAETLNITNHSRPYWNNNVLEIDALDVVPALFYKLIKINRQEQLRIEQIGLRISELLLETFGMILSADYIASLIRVRYAWYLYKKRYIKKLINNIKPKVIIEINGYSTNGLIINEVAKYLKIPTVELQHGIIGRDHIGYNYLVDRRYINLPQILLVYSEYWKKTCRFPIGKNNIIPTGFPYAELQLEKYPKKKRRNDLLTILILSQPVFYSELLRWTQKIVEELKLRKIKFSIIFKLHPTEYSQPIENWKAISRYKEVEIVNDSKKQLYELFSLSDIQLGITSTTVFEGLLYELKTYILNIGNAEERMKDFYENKYGTFCETPEYCVGEIEKYYLARGEKVISNTEKFFKRESLENIVSIIDHYLGIGEE